jgi:hypothetical protein
MLALDLRRHLNLIGTTSNGTLVSGRRDHRMMAMTLPGVRTLRYLYNYNHRKTRIYRSRLHSNMHSDFATEKIYFLTRQVLPH